MIVCGLVKDLDVVLVIFCCLLKVGVFSSWLNSESRNHVDLNEFAHHDHYRVFGILPNVLVVDDVDHDLKNVLRRDHFLQDSGLVVFVQQTLVHEQLK